MQLKDLKANPRNPRKISSQKLDMLKKSVLEFGDLSGFVYNLRTKRLVSGHQKQKVIPGNSKVVITEKYKTPTRCYTVAEGYVEIKGERFKYREVDAPVEWETEAMLAANKHSGDWDTDLLKVVLTEVKNFELTGFTAPEIKMMGIELPQYKNPLEEESDEDYVKNTPQTTEQIPTENPTGLAQGNGGTPDGSAFDEISEKTEVAGKRYVIIIDCKDQEAKDALRDKVRPIVEEAGAKIF